MKTHPFAGAFRTVAEIAEICKLTTAQIERYIASGESIPLTPARIAWTRKQQQASIFLTPVAAAKPCGAPKKPVTIGDRTYQSAEAAARVFGVATKTVMRRHAEAVKEGRQLLPEDVSLKRKRQKRHEK